MTMMEWESSSTEMHERRLRHNKKHVACYMLIGPQILYLAKHTPAQLSAFPEKRLSLCGCAAI